MPLETMIFQVGSELATHKPGANGSTSVEIPEEAEGESDSNTIGERTPRQQDDKRGKANTSEGPYETPVILRTKRWTPSVAQVDDTEADDSETERVVMMKRKKATRVSTTLFMVIDVMLIVPYLEETTCQLGVSTVSPEITEGPESSDDVV